MLRLELHVRVSRLKWLKHFFFSCQNRICEHIIVFSFNFSLCKIGTLLISERRLVNFCRRKAVRKMWLKSSCIFFSLLILVFDAQTSCSTFHLLARLLVQHNISIYTWLSIYLCICMESQMCHFLHCRKVKCNFCLACFVSVCRKIARSQSKNLQLVPMTVFFFSTMKHD